MSYAATAPSPCAFSALFAEISLRRERPGKSGTPLLAFISRAYAVPSDARSRRRNRNYCELLTAQVHDALSAADFAQTLRNQAEKLDWESVIGLCLGMGD